MVVNWFVKEKSFRNQSSNLVWEEKEKKTTCWKKNYLQEVENINFMSYFLKPKLPQISRLNLAITCDQ